MDTSSSDPDWVAAQQFYAATGRLIRDFALADYTVSTLLMKGLGLLSKEGQFLAYGMSLSVRSRKLINLIKERGCYDRFLITMLSELTSHASALRDRIVHWPAYIDRDGYRHWDFAGKALSAQDAMEVVDAEDLTRHSLWLHWFSFDGALTVSKPQRPRSDYLLWKAPAEELPPWWEAARAKLRAPAQAQQAPPKP